MRLRPVRVLIASAVALSLAACNGSTAPSGQAFCAAVTDKLELLRGPVGDTATAGQAVTAYQDVAKVAPAPVRDAWNTVTELVQAAATLDLTSKDAQTKFAERSLEASDDIRTITDYTKTTCDIDLDAAG